VFEDLALYHISIGERQLCVNGKGTLQQFDGVMASQDQKALYVLDSTKSEMSFRL